MCENIVDKCTNERYYVLVPSKKASAQMVLTV
uniref:Uncharacterized protein n=1 Tax=Siphoviridae sp. ctomJ2 TaxID=2827593 RepID=A0A8S5LKL6_9CAUD|nr:MAG TPA: hypothetical protein [Siphoviridae sp. ctomJ2]